jgi:hypothetical protein
MEINMILSPKTIHILKNFSSINPSIVIKPGNVLASIATNKTVLAKAVVPDEFDRQVPIYALNRFLSALSLFTNPDVEFGDNAAVIRGERSSITYHYSDPAIILAPPDKEIKLPSVDVDTTVTNKAMQDVLKAMSVLGLPELAIVGDGDDLSIQAIDVKNPSADTFSVGIGNTDKVFRAVFRAENIKIVDGDYQVQISSKGISKFVGPEVTYWIAIEQSSTF